MGNRFMILCPVIRCGLRTGNTTAWPPTGRSMYCLPTPTAVRVADVTPWIHHMSVKKAYHADPEDTSGHKGPH